MRISNYFILFFLFTSFFDHTFAQSDTEGDFGHWNTLGIGLNSGSIQTEDGKNDFSERATLLYSYEYRGNKVISFPLEFNWWQWREGVGELRHAMMLSGHIKLRLSVGEFSPYVQGGLGTGIEMPFIINVPYGLGCEYSLSEHIHPSIYVRNSIYNPNSWTTLIFFQLSFR